MKLVSHVGITFFLAAVLLVLFPGSTCLCAQPSWWSDPIEPEMTAVEGTLLNPETIVVNLVIRGVPVTLTRWDALVFLSVRDYVEYDNVTRRYYTTDKYQAWRRQHPKGVTGPQNPRGQVVSSQVGGGAGVALPASGSGSVAGGWRSSDGSEIEIHPTGPDTYEATFVKTVPYLEQSGHRVGQLEIKMKWDGRTYTGQILFKSPSNQTGWWVPWSATISGNELATSLGNLVRVR